MDETEQCTGGGCGWLLIITGVFGLAVATLAWLVRLELEEPARTVTVWTTSTGTHYHRRECRALARSEPTEITLAEANDTGLSPCGLCEPPRESR